MIKCNGVVTIRIKLDHWIMQFKTFYSLTHYGNYTIIYKYRKCTRQGSKSFSQETMSAGENRFAPELNEKEVIELLENATPGTTATKYRMKIFQGKNLITLF